MIRYSVIWLNEKKRRLNRTNRQFPSFLVLLLGLFLLAFDQGSASAGIARPAATELAATELAANESETSVTEDGEKTIPENAIPAGDGLYMIPIGKDGDGCEQFSPFSPTKMVATVIYYRDKDGGFTTDKQKADCG